jgi:hypothetical protein
LGLQRKKKQKKKKNTLEMGMGIQRDTRIGHGITTLQSQLGMGLQRDTRNGYEITTQHSKWAWVYNTTLD